MPKRSHKRKSTTRRPTFRSKARRNTRKSLTGRRSGGLGNIHSFKGTINCGVLTCQPSGTSTHLGGQYILHLTDIPNVNGGLSTMFDFIRINKCRMEFLPRFNQQINSDQEATTTFVTFLTGLDPLPIGNTSALADAATWSSQADEDSGVTECQAYDNLRITPDWIRGMASGKETEPYKKHVVHFIPQYYDYAVNASNNNSGISPINGVFQAQRKKWVNLNFFTQSSGALTAVQGPDFYGPCYSFSNNAQAATPVAYYDVKLHYSISLKGYRGI